MDCDGSARQNKYVVLPGCRANQLNVAGPTGGRDRVKARLLGKGQPALDIVIAQPVSAGQRGRKPNRSQASVEQSNTIHSNLRVTAVQAKTNADEILGCLREPRSL